MAVDFLTLTGPTPSGVWFIWENPDTGNVFNVNTSAYEAWNDSHYAAYRVAGTQRGTTNSWIATRPAGVTVPYAFTVRANVDGTLTGDAVRGGGSTATVLNITNS